MAPTWGEWGLLYRRLAEAGEAAAIRRLRADLAKACAAAEALKVIKKTLTDDQRRIVAATVAAEMTKQSVCQ
jgi:hypothetical protein